MIHEGELEQLKAVCKGKADLFAILARVDIVHRFCVTCGRRDNLICTLHGGEIPTDYHGPCEEWDFKDVPF